MTKPLTRETTIEAIKAHMDELRAMGVESLALFGSVARNEATESSDVDILVDMDPNRRISLFDLIDVQIRLEEVLGVEKVDLVMREAVIDELKKVIYTEAIRVA